MALAGKLAGVVSSILVLVALVMAGCQGQRAEAPAAGLGSARNVPAGASEEVLSGKSQVPGDDPALQTSHFKPPTSEEPRHGVTTNEITSEVKKEQAEAGKAEPPGPAVELALRFVPGRAATYRITTELQKSVEWKGPAETKPPKFTGGRTGNHVELRFQQQVRQVQEDGAAVLEITIKGLKYVGEVVSKVVLDFDSARPTDSVSPLAALVGKSYQVKMSPKGQVLEISGVESVRQAMQGDAPGQSVALRLLSDDEIRNRHEIVALSALKDRSVRPGQTWNSLKTFSFDDLGTKTYERVYTLKQVGSGQLSVPSSQSPAANRQLSTDNSQARLAVVEMKAIPSAARAAELHQGPANPFVRMSDNTDSYEGRLVLDLDSGQVREYAEQMQNEWIIADPSSMQTGQPTAIKMTARRLHRLEMVQ